ncbi:MAG: hypothetical protein SGJ20_01410 [Planctomycetota bacterium]|nr:hypothetical protein [Planctomycetota bacterium]
MHRKPLLSLALLVLLVSAGGAQCPWMLRSAGPPIPVILPQAATLDQVVRAVKDNSDRVQNARATQASISFPGAPPFQSEIAFERQRRFRLRARAMMLGDQVDIGSNDEIFWVWIAKAEPKATYVCRHDQFAGSAVRSIMPVDADWLIDAFGIPTFGPNERIEGHAPIGKGRIEIKSRIQTTGGELVKTTIVDESKALVLQQNLYNARGDRLATATTSDHIRDGLSGVNLPRKIEIDWPMTNMRFTITVASWLINSLPAEQNNLWVKPEIPGFPDVDLADPNLQFNVPGQPPGSPPPVGMTAPGTGYTPEPTYGPASYGQPATNPAAGYPTPGYPPPNNTAPQGNFQNNPYPNSSYPSNGVAPAVPANQYYGPPNSYPGSTTDPAVGSYNTQSSWNMPDQSPSNVTPAGHYEPSSSSIQPGQYSPTSPYGQNPTPPAQPAAATAQPSYETVQPPPQRRGFFGRLRAPANNAAPPVQSSGGSSNDSLMLPEVDIEI